MDIKELKKDYEKLAKKYSLPPFKNLNDDFEIGKVDKDVGALLRAVRKVMMEKIVNSMSFIEMLLNPVQAPRMYQNYIKSMSVDDRKRIDKIYGALAGVSILSLERELDYSEKSEAEVIKQVYKIWNSLKKDFAKILHNLKNPPKNSVKKERSYFG